MSEFVSIEDEQREKREAQQDARLNAFPTQWDMETIPACDKGMSLLLDFAQAQPSVYRLVFVRGFSGDPHPMVKNLPKWKAFAEHVSTCQKCNER